MRVLVLAAADVELLLDRDALIDAVAAGLADLSAGRASVPPRLAAEVADHGALLAAMPGALPGMLGAKLVSVFPRNVDRPTHQALIVMFDADTGAVEAVLDGTVVTAERTAAASAVATSYLARPDAEVLAVIGTGVQALSHLRTVPRVCPNLQEIRVAGRTRARAEAVVAQVADELAVPVVASRTFATALDGADVVCAATHASTPVVRRRWLLPGVHVNSVGFNPEGREVDAATVADALVVVESRASALAPVPAGANDLLWPIRDGVISASHVHAELGELVAGSRLGRAHADQITLYKSVGVAVEDLAAASLLVATARRRGVGREIDL